MAAERIISLPGGMQLKLFKASFMLSESSALAFFRSDISNMPEDVWKALSTMFTRAYEKGRMDQKTYTKEKYKEFLKEVGG